jgi:uncharacterized protein (TIGR03067 family)
MRRHILVLGLGFVATLIGFALTADVFAQRGQGKGRGSGGWGPGSQYSRLYDSKTVETLEGQVVSVDYHIPRNTTGRGVHVNVKTAKETIAVHLGPEWFTDNQDTQIEKGDKIKVRGSRVTFEDKPVIIAAEIQKGDEVLDLRDEQGFPRWAGWRRGGQGTGSGGWGPGSNYGRMYDPKTVETLEGEIVGVHYHTAGDRSGRGVHAMVKTTKETIELHLGPWWYVEKQDVQVKKGDRVKVNGSRITYEGKPALIAADIQKGDELLELRDKQGFPRWAGGRAGAAQDATTRELEQLQGTWQMVSHEVDGKPDEALKDAVRVVKGDKFTIKQGDKVLRAATMKLDPTRTPKWIDITFTEGPEKGKVRRGIYVLEGDTQKICYGDLNKERPTEFVSESGTGHRLVVFMRSKP